ncbi:MAG TPA: adenylate/guanylate cyclase domain-containing protein, partial [Actinomycetota bacterium]|nr:adenylate/guanylate cyclase domain-containing protein [Actinomycetota bacterium]
MDASEQLRPFVPRLIYDWVRTTPDEPARQIDGSLAFIDISGFTSLTERLARRGRIGAEEMNDVLNGLFAQLIPVAYEDGASLVKWGGDAALLLFDGEEHAAHACRAAINMQRTIKRAGQITTSAGQVRLRMSIGISSGTFGFFLVGDPEIHRELVIAGPASTETVLMEQTAEAGEVAISETTAALIDRDALGMHKGTAILLRSAPEVPAHPAPPPPDPTGIDLASFVPLAVRDYLLSGAADPEHRRITAAFVEFGGTDDLLEREGPRATAEAIDACLRTVQQAAARHEVGFFETDVSRNAWRIMLIIGAPTSPGGDEDRMLATLRTVLETPLPLPVKIGANAGHVFSAYFGPPFRKTYSVKGDAVNLAARLMAKAPPGELYTTAAVLDRSGSRFELTELEPFLVKGKAKPVRAFSVGPRIGSGEKVGSGTSFPLLGRDKEFEVLRSALEDARRGIAGLVELSGEAGIGKTRLAHELIESAGDFAMVGAVGETYTAWTPYVAWRGVLRELFALSWEDTSDVVVARLTAIATEADPSLLPWLPLIATAADADMAPTPEVRDLRPEFLRRKLHEVMRDFLHAVVEGPTLFVFEDAQLMDEASADLLSAIASAGVEDRPWLFLTMRRTIGDGFVAPEAHGVQRIDVGPIGREVAVELAELATEDRPLPGYVLQQGVDRAGGNPQFLLDLMTAAGEGVGTLPESVEAAATVRIDQLEPFDRELVRRASVFGLAFHPRFFDDILDEGMPKPDAATWGRLEEFFDEEDDGYLRFRRAVIRDAAYGGLPFRVRRRIHEVAGRLFEQMVTDPNESAGLLSLHFAAAARWDKAYRYAGVAASHATEIFANVEAVRFLDRAIEAGRKNGEPEADIARLSEKLGDTYFLLGRYEEAVRAYGAARRGLSEDPVSQAWLFHQQARIPFRASSFSQAIRLVNRGLRMLDDVDGYAGAETRAQLLALQLGARMGQGRSGEAITLADDLIRETDRMPSIPKVLEAKARALSLLDGILIERGR